VFDSSTRYMFIGPSCFHEVLRDPRVEPYAQPESAAEVRSRKREALTNVNHQLDE
jgi:hypothetical protein